MKTPQVYRPLAKTIVTEMRQFTVDRVRRTAVNAFSVATKITEVELEQKDFVVSPERPYTLVDVHNIVSIQCPHPITIELVSHGLMPAAPSNSEQVFHDAVMEVGTAYASRFVEVKVTDKDIFTAAPLKVSAMNMRTGETEEFDIQRVNQGEYQGYLPTQNDDAKGVDFDGVMYCRKDDILRFFYNEAYAANGASREVTVDVPVELAFKETVIDAPDTIPFDSYLNFNVQNPVSNKAVVTNVTSGVSKDIVLFNKAPIHLGATDGPNSFAVQEGDAFKIVTDGRDVFNNVVQIVKEFKVADALGLTVPTLDFIDQQLISKPFYLTLRDDDMPDGPLVQIRNQNTGMVTHVPMEEAYPYSGRYHYIVENIAGIGLPGHTLVVQYGGTLDNPRVQKSLHVVMPEQDCENPVVKDNGVVASAPVVLTVNGHFFLNGSFAGTIKLMSDKPVRCTVVKA
ncbi:hypothetical protein LU11_gp062 [Pseudomonas phage Lu11]|uniref:hypothetical protein n=1 Tax=Pseudomonas phage Lu11 TaxID=1161927 RepID=UPI00025F1518|nr:hypothetical protein LU11_gp062 [Pseudomonas phage Lu11]AFH14593.1 hypothetical protein Lu11_0062 [Pseudomonas phage Lu11]